MRISSFDGYKYVWEEIVSMFDVIIPIYNVEESLLIACFDSVQQQTFSEFSVWVCDGKPTQKIKSLVESYGFNYIEQDNERHKRVGGARNQAVSYGVAPYLAFLDGDDKWYSYHLEEMAKEIKSAPPSTVVFSSVCDTHYRLESYKTGEVYEVERLYGHYEPYDFILKHPYLAYYWFFGHPPAPTALAVKRDAFEEVGGFDERFSILRRHRMLDENMRRPPKGREVKRICSCFADFGISHDW
jgi:glycosyltransferase involved in cell wall biosynthesis